MHKMVSRSAEMDDQQAPAAILVLKAVETQSRMLANLLRVPMPRLEPASTCSWMAARCTSIARLLKK